MSAGKQSVEIAQLQAEVEHWKAHAEEAGRGFSQVCKDYARVSARNVLLVEGIEALARAADGNLQHNTAALSLRLRELASRPGSGLS